MSHPSESTHWYTLSGEPAYTVKAKDGSDRPTTLRDARKLNLVPSVTTIIRSAAAPGLERWKQQQVLHAALTLPTIPGEPEDAYLARIMADSQEQAKKAAERGTAIHAAIQGHFEGKPPSEEYWPHVRGTADALTAWVKDSVVWDAEQSFADPMGFGGKCDLSSENIVVDFKTKEFKEDAKLDTWDEHAMQLAAYRVGLSMPTARCAIAYVSTIVSGLCRICEVNRDDLDRGWEMFKALLKFWQAKNKYFPNTW